MSIAAIVALCVGSALAGGFGAFVWLQARLTIDAQRLAKLTRENVALERRLGAVEAHLRPQIEDELREQIAQEQARLESTFTIPNISGRSYGETKAMLFQLLDMQRRELPLSVRRCKEYHISRRVYEDLREALVALGYWAWQEGETPEWTETGLQYLDWFNRKHGDYFQKLQDNLLA